MIKQIAIINKSTIVNSADLAKMVGACNIQISRDVAPAWGRQAVPVISYGTVDAGIPAGSAKIYIFDNADQAGALGYHTETMGGQVFGKIFAKTITDYGLPIIYDGSRRNSITVSSVLSHEVVETFVNPYVNLWSDGPTVAQGNEYVFEACDPVEGDSYQISITTGTTQKTLTSLVSVSDFVYPEYFDTASPTGTKLDYLSKLRQPFTISVNGYTVVRNASGTETPIYGATLPPILKLLKG